MEELKIVLKYTKEDIWKFQVYNLFKRSKLSSTFFIVVLVLGLIGIILSIIDNDLYMIYAGIFLLSMLGFIVFIAWIQSLVTYKTTKVYQEENEIAFFDEYIFSTTENSSQKLYWDKIYEVHWTKKELIIYLGKFLGIYLARSKYNPETLYRIEELLKKKIPLNKFKLK